MCDLLKAAEGIACCAVIRIRLFPALKPHIPKGRPWVQLVLGADAQWTLAREAGDWFCPLQSQGKPPWATSWKARVTCTEIWEVWSTAEVAVGCPARKSPAVGPPVVIRWASCRCHLLFARPSSGDERVPREHTAHIKKYCTPLPWQCKSLAAPQSLRSWWDVEADVVSLTATKQDGMEKATLQLSGYTPTHEALGSPLTRKFPSQQGSYSISISYF